MMENNCLYLFLLSFLIPIVVVAAFPTSNTSSPYWSEHPSHVSECHALLHFGNSFTITLDASADYYCGYPANTSYPKTASWKNGTDCCSWDGVTCHTSENYVISLDLSCSWLHGTLHSNSTLFSLSNLRGLNLAVNDFSGSLISPRFSVFAAMTHLNLSCSGFSGPVPEVISQYLSNLISLDLSVNYGLTIEDDHSFRRLVGNLTHMGELVLDLVDMSRVSPLSLANLSSTLTSLSLSNCFLRGIFPNNIFHLPYLRSLSLSVNINLTGTLPQTNWTGPLVSLDLSYTKFHGLIPTSVGNLTSLNYLDLSVTEFTGPFPQSLGKLHHLTDLFISGYKLSGTVDFEMFASLKNLRHLSLAPFPEENNLTLLLQNDGNCSFPRLKWLELPGYNLTKLPYFLNSSTELEGLNLSGNNIGGEIHEWFWRVWRDTLTLLHLYSNNFTGEIPSSICQVSSLRLIDLSNNRLDGTIPRCLGNLSSLVRLILGNNLLQGPMPQSLANCRSLSHLNVRYNEIYDTFPHWLNATLYSLTFIDLQSNKFHGVINEIPLPPQLSSLILSDNNFEGPLPIPPPTIEYFIVSDNKFGGNIPHQICKAFGLEVIDLSNNSLTGSIPRCFIELSASLSVLDLHANNFVGLIPEMFIQNTALTTIRLSQNRLGGTLPRSLAYCKNLEVLDLSKNELEGRFPFWLETLPNLQVLVLRSNRFHGPVDSSSKTDHPFQKLRIFDLSNNNFSGPLPIKYIANLIAMRNEERTQRSGLQYMGGQNQFYRDSIVVVMKGLEIVLVKILTVFTTIDFSSNFFEGEIPEAIGQLEALKGLNFSHNNLTGIIPSSIGSLDNVEWLDLSSNRLTGEIPITLAHLSFLSYLNLSMNQLVGPIPQSAQIDTFKIDSFDGNPGLCGHPLPKACGTDSQPSPPLTSPKGEEAESIHWIEKRAVLMGFGCGVVLGISLGYLVLVTGRPWWLVKMVERKYWAIKTNKLKKGAAPGNPARGR
ncbi:hypothetical protein CRG98_046139 [Punica granatum]|uniref:Leucine-rich repeat-containing N-terminal plant-type domain-containing protein n=1 Tax=Punica granatum TaxID=22663 RepID=A0A2I0HP33_PUNGR|nr:hypothetical protein CRG98_046139 [Punica granatum]